MYENSDSKVKIAVRSVGSKASKPLQHVFQMYVAVCRMVVVVGTLISSFDLANISDRTTSLSVSSSDRRTQSGTIRWDTGNGREQIGREKRASFAIVSYVASFVIRTSGLSHPIISPYDT